MTTVTKKGAYLVSEYACEKDRVLISDNEAGSAIQVTILRDERKIDLYRPDLALLLAALENHGMIEGILKKP
jgi:hypothetical protein